MIKTDFIHKLEGCSLTGYVPDPENSKSGVTISTGYDIGQHYKTEMISAFSDGLARKLTPYAGLVKQEAVVALEKNPLTITNEEAKEITSWCDLSVKNWLFNRWDDVAEIKFNELSDEQQTVLASVAYQYGDLARKTPKFWGHATHGDWPAVIAELKDFKDAFPTRRGKEARLLEDGFSALDSGVGDGPPEPTKPK